MAVRNIIDNIQSVDNEECLYSGVYLLGPQDVNVHCRFYRKNELVFI